MAIPKRLRNPSGFTGKQPGDQRTDYGWPAEPQEQEPAASPEVISTEDSLEGRRDALSQALREKFPGKQGGVNGKTLSMGESSPYVQDFTEDFVIFDHQGSLKAAPYSMNGSKAVVGEPFEVSKQYVRSQQQTPAEPEEPTEPEGEVEA